MGKFSKIVVLLSLAFLMIVGIGFPAAYIPLDGTLSASTDYARLFDVINKTRNIPSEYPYSVSTISAGAFNSTLKIYNSSIGQTAFGAILHTDLMTAYPVDARTILQINETAWISGKLDLIESKANTKAWQNFGIVSSVESAFGGYDFLYEVGQQSAAGMTYPFVCYIHIDKLPYVDSVSFNSLCGAPQGLFAGTEVVNLVYVGNSSVVVPLTVGAPSTIYAKATSLVLSMAHEYRIDVVSAYGTETLSLGTFPTLGSREFSWTQGAEGNTTSFLVSTESGYPLYSTTTDNVSVYATALNPYSASVYDSQTESIFGSIYTQFPGFPSVAESADSPVLLSAVYREMGVFTYPNFDMQMLLFGRKKLNTGAITTVIQCPTNVEVLANMMIDVLCPTVAVQTTAESVGLLDAAPPTVFTFNSSLFSYRASITNEAAGFAVTDAFTGAVIPTQFSYPSALIKNQVYSSTTTRTFRGNVIDSSGVSHYQNFPMQFKVVTALSNSSGYAENHKAVFVSSIKNSSGTFPIGNFTVDISGSTNCTTSISALNVSGSNYTTDVAYCSVYLPNQLREVSTTYSYNGSSVVLNQTYWGYYSTETLSPFGIHAGQYASAYFLIYDSDTHTLSVKLESETCNEPEVSPLSVGDSERCKLFSCPLTHTWQVVPLAGTFVSVNPKSLTCQTAGQSVCYLDSLSGRSYKAYCGDTCGVTLSFCQTSCNSALTGCFGEQTQAETDVDAAIAANPFLNFAFGGGGTSSFFVGIVVSILLAFGAWNVMKAHPDIRGKFAMGVFMFCFAGVAILTQQWFIIGLVVLVLVVFAILFMVKTYGGITGLKG